MLPYRIISMHSCMDKMILWLFYINTAYFWFSHENIPVLWNCRSNCLQVVFIALSPEFSKLKLKSWLC